MESDQEPYNQRYYDNIFLRELHNSQRNQNRLKLVRSCQAGGRLLEVGCGRGEFLRMADAYYTVEGIDVSRHAVESLQKWIKGDGRVRRENISESPLPPNTYQVIAAFNILEHLPNPAPVVSKLFGALKPQGALVGSVPYNAAWLGSIHTCLTNLFDRTHCSTLRPEAWRRLFEGSGFTRVEFFGECLLGKNLSKYVRSKVWPLVALNLMFVCVKE